MTQTERILSALRTAGPRGITQSMFTPPEGGTVIDGGGRITRVAARVLELRAEGYVIVKGARRDGFDTYVLVGYPPVEDRSRVELAHGWVRAHFCRRCDFPGVRPCGPVCPSCGRDAIATVLLDTTAIEPVERAA